MSQIDEAKERRLFEDACYDYYQKRAAAGEVDTRDAGDGSREALFWRHPDGTYGVQMFNAAWFGWRERALLEVQQPPRVYPGKTAEQAIAQWEHDFANPLTTEQAEDFARRERAFAAQRPSQKPASLCDCKGRFYDRCESAWEPYCVLGKSSEHAVVSKAVMPKPNVHMDGYVRTDRPNGDGL